ncbi:FtsK/SpoIIIE domain-containing protein [Dactylosporangium sp. NPDC051485]|uniref:FtsK/SpoIIIE domain-containing protein n=1 Tax=Dactylosporangium sp. NPDC051485 TaxID=3154846 RepID=UPI0034201189
MLRSWIVQLATLVGPNDLALVVLTTPDEAEHWTWTGWLPHTRTLTSAFAPGARTVAAREDDRRRVLALVEALLRQRRLGRHAIAEQFTPHVVVVLPDPDSVPHESLARLVEDGPRGGISLLTAAPEALSLPPGVVALEGEGIAAAVADRVAHALAATRDAAGNAAPRLAPLGEVLSLGGEPAPSSIVKRWVPSTRDRGLAAPIGLGSTGPVLVDLRRDGPNGLIAGAPGSGRSWLLRSYLVGLAATYPANRLTFVLVDPDGTTFGECADLPHTVGVFTGDDGYRARRVLISLGAEVRRREGVLRRHAVKDIVEMERRHPAAAPANLLIVVAELAAAPPDFVTGLRELARRGRPAGVHLLLSTAHPHGLVDDDLRAEAPLRIALRVDEEQDSLEVLERPDAAHLSPLLPGRAFVRAGAAEPEAVQVAYGGARSPADRAHGPTLVTEWRFESGLHMPEPSQPEIAERAPGSQLVPVDGEITDLRRLVAAITAAHREARVPDQPRAWQPPMLPTYELSEVSDKLAAATAGTGADEVRSLGSRAAFSAPIGMVDLPGSQAVQVWPLDLDELGHLLVYGPAGAGKTTLLNTIAASFGRRFDGAALRVYWVDAADVPAATALLGTIGELVAERTALAEHDGARVLVLVDGHDPMLNDALTLVAAGGKAVGVHLVLATEQRSAVPTSLARLMSGRIVLRSGGRGLVEGTIELQVATAPHGAPAVKPTTPSQRPRQLQLEV